MFRLGAIWAQTDVGIIGRNGDMPWYAPEDLAHFKKVTLGAPVIMGRRTWESFPPRFRPLPGRTNIVISRSVTEAEERDGALWVPSLDAALYAARDAAGAPVEATPADTAAVDAWIIGGGSVYAEALSAPTCPPSVGWRRWSGPSSTARKATRLPAIRERPNCSLQILRAVARAAHRTGAGESPPKVLGRIARRATCSMSRARRTPCTSRSSGSNVSSSSFPRSLVDIDMHFKPAAAPPGVPRA